MENLETDSDLLTADIGDCFLRIQHEKSLVKKEDIMGRGGLRSALMELWALIWIGRCRA